MTQRDEDAELEEDIARQERIVEMEALKLTGLLTQRDMRRIRMANVRGKYEPR